MKIQNNQRNNMILQAPAKINLGLYLGNNRTDGYHDILTVMAPVTLYDILELTPQKQDECIIHLVGSKEQIPLQDNLVWKAWHLLKTRHNIGGVKISLIKNIPSGAGLGGGSSDATYALRGLNTMFHLELSTRELMCYAAELGSDCPFFAQDDAALSMGRGEIIINYERLDNLYSIIKSKYKIAILKPHKSVSTRDAYNGVKEYSLTNEIIKSNHDVIVDKYLTKIKEFRLLNDFEPSVIPQCEEIKDIIDFLRNNGADYVQMSGSGSAVYGLFDSSKMKEDGFLKMKRQIDSKIKNDGLFAFWGDLA